jgi:hypothetical protein
VANDERSTAPSSARPDDVVTGGNSNGNGRSGARKAMSALGESSMARQSTTTTGPSVDVTRPAPAPAVPLVPPVRSPNRPSAPVTPTVPVPLVRRAPAARPAPVHPFDDEVVEPVSKEQPRVGPAQAPGLRLRPPVRMRMARRPRVRKVSRVVRRIDAWSVFKIALLFWTVVFVILLVAGMLLWNLAESTGTITNIEGFIKDLFGLKTFEFDGGQILRSSWIIGAVLIVGGTAMTVTLTVLFNLISDLLGGVRVTVLEEEVILRPQPAAAPPAEASEPPTD